MNKLQIQVLTRDGQKHIYETDRWRNVADFKRHIGRTMKVPMGFSRLTYNGRVLTNDSILDDYIIKDEGVKRLSTLELCWQPLVLTAKQYREKELELDKLERKARKRNHERTSSGVRWARDQVRAKPAFGMPEVKPNAIVLSQPPVKPMPKAEKEKESCMKTDPTSTASEDSDFLAAYWCCSKTAIQQSENILDDVLANVPPVKEDDSNVSASPDGARCLACKHQMLRSEARSTAGRMSRSIISHIKKNQKNCKK